MNFADGANIGGDLNVTLGNSADEIVAKVVAALDQRGDSAKAVQAGLERETIFHLARCIRPEVIGFEQAVKELENAVATALDVIAKGERGSNQETFVEDILKRLAETTKKGDFDAGAKTVDDGIAVLDQQADALRRSRETLLEAGVEQDLLRRDPAAVARRIEAIAAMNRTGGNPAWSQTYRKRWIAFYAEGEEKGINLSLEVAIVMATRMLESADNADRRGIALIFLGTALACLGERESGTIRLEKAVISYREALQIINRDSNPRQWAITQNHLGGALLALGERERGTTQFAAEAIFVYHQALEVCTREQMPIDWAETKMDLGTAFHALGTALHAQGAGESGRARLKEAIAAFHDALLVNVRIERPLEWATTMMNLGNTLARLGEWEGDTAWLEQAIAAFREALEENTRERVPLAWCKIKINLGIALAALGRQEPGIARFQEAVSSYHEALQILIREQTPLLWAVAKNNLGLALAMLGVRESCMTRLVEAIAAYREALEENTRVRVPFLWAQTQENLASVYLAHFHDVCQTCQLDAALEAVNGALEEYRRAESQFYIKKAEGLREVILGAKSNL
ncbi:tetratricopeptide repeat protein [Methylocapsa sp. D3K7]|uniref:tetratricopeptide repeat protein n=1 Tax=Methylocapsa sp. D3K7 TaxID=3041435 RepID=UPI00244EDB52|nr:tetratricopeptide repeat protein [Methylocapsa sp. D3K7]WGJ14837.1 tetratricopeptide repeat protein [Methylocapsa sp. D3K7]